MVISMQPTLFIMLYWDLDCYIIHIVILGKLSYQSDLKSWIVWIGSAALNT